MKLFRLNFPQTLLAIALLVAIIVATWAGVVTHNAHRETRIMELEAKMSELEWEREWRGEGGGESEGPPRSEQIEELKKEIADLKH